MWIHLFSHISKAAILKIKNYVPFIHWCKTASFMAVDCSAYKCKLKVSFKTNDLAYQRIIDLDAHKNL